MANSPTAVNEDNFVYAAADVFSIISPYIDHTQASRIFSEVSSALRRAQETSAEVTALLQASEKAQDRERQLRSEEAARHLGRLKELQRLLQKRVEKEASWDAKRRSLKRRLRAEMEQSARVQERLKEVEAKVQRVYAVHREEQHALSSWWRGTLEESVIAAKKAGAKEARAKVDAAAIVRMRALSAEVSQLRGKVTALQTENATLLETVLSRPPTAADSSGADKSNVSISGSETAESESGVTADEKAAAVPAAAATAVEEIRRFFSGDRGTRSANNTVAAAPLDAATKSARDAGAIPPPREAASGSTTLSPRLKFATSSPPAVTAGDRNSLAARDGSRFRPPPPLPRRWQAFFNGPRDSGSGNERPNNAVDTTPGLGCDGFRHPAVAAVVPARAASESLAYHFPASDSRSAPRRRAGSEGLIGVAAGNDQSSVDPVAANVFEAHVVPLHNRRRPRPPLHEPRYRDTGSAAGYTGATVGCTGSTSGYTGAAGFIDDRPADASLGGSGGSGSGSRRRGLGVLPRRAMSLGTVGASDAGAGNGARQQRCSLGGGLPAQSLEALLSSGEFYSSRHGSDRRSLEEAGVVDVRRQPVFPASIAEGCTRNGSLRLRDHNDCFALLDKDGEVSKAADGAGAGAGAGAGPGEQPRVNHTPNPTNRSDERVARLPATLTAVVGTSADGNGGDRNTVGCSPGSHPAAASAPSLAPERSRATGRGSSGQRYVAAAADRGMPGYAKHREIAEEGAARRPPGQDEGGVLPGGKEDADKSLDELLREMTMVPAAGSGGDRAGGVEVSERVAGGVCAVGGGGAGKRFEEQDGLQDILFYRP